MGPETISQKVNKTQKSLKIQLPHTTYPVRVHHLICERVDIEGDEQSVEEMVDNHIV